MTAIIPLNWQLYSTNDAWSSSLHVSEIWKKRNTFASSVCCCEQLTPGVPCFMPHWLLIPPRCCTWLPTLTQHGKDYRSPCGTTVICMTCGECYSVPQLDFRWYTLYFVSKIARTGTFLPLKSPPKPPCARTVCLHNVSRGCSWLAWKTTEKTPLKCTSGPLQRCQIAPAALHLWDTTHLKNLQIGPKEPPPQKKKKIPHGWH